jgi:signal transduction histidine kinase
LAREMGRRIEKIDYPLLVACAYIGLAAGTFGIFAYEPQEVSRAGHALEPAAGILPLAQTALSSMALSGFFLGTAAILVWVGLICPAPKKATPPEAEILQRTDELKTALLNAVSHDLKTPLASIIASAGSLLQEDVAWTGEERHEFARAIEEEAGYLNRLVTNLLDLSRIEAGALRPDKDWHDLGGLIDDVLGRLRTLTARHQVAVDVPEELPPVSLDYLEISDVLLNLIENATKHTPAGTEIRVSAREARGEVQVEVAGRRADARRPDALGALGLKPKSRVTFHIDGEDQEQARCVLEKLAERRFYVEEELDP